MRSYIGLADHAIFALIVITVVVAGCAVGWDLLEDEELRRLIRVALAENKDLQGAVASVEEFQSRLLISNMDFVPKAEVTATEPAFGRKANFCFQIFPIHSTTISKEIYPGSWIFRGGFGVRAELASLAAPAGRG